MPLCKKCKVPKTHPKENARQLGGWGKARSWGSGRRPVPNLFFLLPVFSPATKAVGMWYGGEAGSSYCGEPDEPVSCLPTVREYVAEVSAYKDASFFSFLFFLLCRSHATYVASASPFPSCPPRSCPVLSVLSFLKMPAQSGSIVRRAHMHEMREKFQKV